MRLEKVLNAMKSPEDVLLVHVSEENIQTVLGAECTAVITAPKSLEDKKSIVIKSKNGMIVAVGTIEEITEYDSSKYGHLWERNNPEWRSFIKFGNVIPIGEYVDRVFGSNTNIKYCETVMSLKNPDDLKNLKEIIKTAYAISIKVFLARIGLDK